MISAKQILLYMNKIYNGNWDKIFQAIKDKQETDDKAVENIEKEIQHPFVTVLDKDYPALLKSGYKPPVCLFYEGDLALLNRQDLIAISRTNIKDIKNKDFIQDVLNSYVLVSGYNNDADEETLRIAVKNNKKFILILNTSLDDIDYDDEIINYALHNGCLLITEFGFENDEEDYEIHRKYRLLAPILSRLIVASGKKTDLQITLLVDEVLDRGGDVFALPEPPFENSLTNTLIKNGAYLVDSFLDVQGI